ncbi:MAG: outer membrane protein assembly factor BamD [Candidatus Sabulitectum sp.]|nr:outer membrane protein assembly factor BamD [Candidatus Sabulitectum sp.]
MIKYAVIIVLLVFMAGCGSFPSTVGMDREQIIELADLNYQQGKWTSASFLYTELMFRYPGDMETDLFLYRSGMADRKQKLWADAEFYFYRVVNEFPRGVWADDAQFALAETMWMQRRDYRRDQTQVIRAREEIIRFLDIYPASQLLQSADELFIQINDHLALRALFIGKFYIRRHDTDAALLYLRDAMDSYGETSCRGAVLIAMGDLYRSIDNRYSAQTYYNRAMETCDLTPDEEEEAVRGLREVQ